ncbi:acyl-CoA thioesterase [Shouchella lonarensis]|uniref:Acyl-CoA hydrolase n=1 Tax=Shouchella lonarensis TaxID=1464122 RepID=A0A1G6HAH9_9BACI|nr:acyl-CoA thioesterase [Shouchella lonarensis]SDB91282.1 Acyl-CoA hydrolase [Shouchella lonarensis]
MTTTKRSRESRTVLTDIVLPPDTNYHGTIFGGNVMAYVDKVASIAAMRHSRMQVVTAASDSFDFLAPIKTGEAICIEGYVTSTRTTSMEVFVKVEAEDLLTGERRQAATSYLTFVALDGNGKPASVPRVVPETEEEKWHFAGAQERYEIRKRRREQQRT